MLVDIDTQKKQYFHAMVLFGIMICVVIAGPVFVILDSSNAKSSNQYNLNAITLESLLGSIVILILMSIWVALMYRNRPEIITEEEFSIINVENLDKNESSDLESSNNCSFDEQSTHSNSQYCPEELRS